MTTNHTNSERGYIEAISGITSEAVPFVHLHVRKGAEELIVQVDVEQAREIGLHIIEAAEASLTDSLIMRFFTSRISLNFDRAAAILMDFRTLRAALGGVKNSGANDERSQVTQEGQKKETNGA